MSPMKLLVWGMNHKTVPLEMRERFYLNDSRRDFVLSELKNSLYCTEALILSTCNRTELYVYCSESFPIRQFMVRIFAEVHAGVDFVQDEFVYMKSDRDAVEHLFRVTSSLDSLVLGETEIVGQVREGMKRSIRRRMFGTLFHTIFDVALQVSKLAHTQTDIRFGGTSVAWATVQNILNLDADAYRKKTVLLGTGAVGKGVVRELNRNGFDDVVVLNRRLEKARDIATEYRVQWGSICDLQYYFGLASYVIVAVSNEVGHEVISLELMQRVSCETSHHLQIYDLSVPRAVEKSVADLCRVSLYNVDSLEGVIEKSLARRQKAIYDVEFIIQEKLEYCFERLRGSTVSKQLEYLL